MTLNDEDRQKLNELHTALLGIKGTKDIGFVGETKEVLDDHAIRLGSLEKWRWYLAGGGFVLIGVIKYLGGH